MKLQLKTSPYQERPNHLGPSELCDLVNYILRLPVTLHTHTIYPPIPLQAIVSWPAMWRDELERWCEWDVAQRKRDSRWSAPAGLATARIAGPGPALDPDLHAKGDDR